MSMYGLVFGTNPQADAILATLGLRRADCGRFRDCFVADGRIAVYTRNGGGNRRQAGLGAGNLDHQIRPAYALPDPFGSCQRALGVLREVGVDFKADVAIASGALLIHRSEQIRRRLDILDRKLPEDLFRALAGLRQRR